MPLDQSKIIFRNGSSDNLPLALLPGELGVTVDDGKVFIGPDQRYGLKQSDRLVAYPYRNIEILTEQSDTEFSALHSERMREGIYHNYYEARLEPDTVRWTDVGVAINGDLIDYRITLNDNITAFIDYTIVSDESGEAIRKGQMILWHTGGEVSFTDNASQSRDKSLIGRSSYDPRDVFGRIKFRFIELEGALAFQYRNWSFDAHTMNFKVSRPYIGVESAGEESSGEE